MRTFVKHNFIAILLLTLSLTACSKTPVNNSKHATDSGLHLINAYIPYRSDQQQHFAAYFELQNNTDKAISIIEAYSPAFGMVMLHETVFEDDMAKMKHVEALHLTPHASVNFKPKGKHVMLMQPKRDFSMMSGVYLILELNDGQKLKYDIDFQKNK